MNLINTMENNNAEYWEEISKLKKTYYGEEDAYVEKHIGTPYRPKMKYHGTYPLEQINCITYLFPKINVEKFVYKNLKLDGEIESCQLEQNGKIIDNVDGVIFPTLRLLYGITDVNIIPLSFCKENEFLLPTIWNTKLIVHTNNNINLSVDIYEIIDDCERLTDMIITQIQSNAKQIAYRYYRLCFLHLVKFIIIYLPKGLISRFRLQFNGHDTHITILDTIYHNNQYIIPLAKYLTNDGVHGINFSSADSVYINLWCDAGEKLTNDDYLCIYGVSYNGIKINSIKSELAFN